MGVYKHPSKPGFWMIRISRGRQGKAEYIPWSGDRDSALRFERELRGEADRSDPDFADFLPDFLLQYRNRCRPKTVESIKYSLAHLEKFFGSYKLRQITAVLVERYKAVRLKDGVKKRTINIELSALSSYLRWVNTNRGTSFHLPKLFTRRETKAALPRVLTPTETAALVEQLVGDLRVIVELMAWCGLRRNEALGLTAAEVDPAGAAVTVSGKGGKWRRVPVVYPGLLARLAELCRQRPTGPLFPSPVDPGEPRKDIRKPLRTAAKAAGITKEVRPHLLRHSFGAAMVNNGADIRIIQELLGHSELTTTQLYTQVADLAGRLAMERMVTNVTNDKTQSQSGFSGESS